MANTSLKFEEPCLSSHGAGKAQRQESKRRTAEHRVPLRHRQKCKRACSWLFMSMTLAARLGHVGNPHRPSIFVCRQGQAISKDCQIQDEKDHHDVTQSSCRLLCAFFTLKPQCHCSAGCRGWPTHQKRPYPIGKVVKFSSHRSPRDINMRPSTNFFGHGSQQ